MLMPIKSLPVTLAEDVNGYKMSVKSLFLSLEENTLLAT